MVQSQNLAIPFAISLDTKTDPKQVLPTNMLRLKNAVFTKDKRIQKRWGFRNLSTFLTSKLPTTLAITNDTLIGLGDRLYAYVSGTNQWIDHGAFQSVQLDVKPLARNSLAQTRCDMAVSSLGLAVVSYLDGDGESKYQVSDVNSGQVLIGPVQIETGAKNPRSFVLANYFIVTYTITVTATPRLRFIAIPITNLANPNSPQEVSTDLDSDTTGYDGYCSSDVLYLGWNGDAVGGELRLTKIDSNLNQYATTVIAGTVGDLLSVTVDETQPSPIVWMTSYDSSGGTSESTCFSALLAVINTEVINWGTIDPIVALTSVAQDQTLTMFAEVDQDYSFAAVRTDYVLKQTVDQAGNVGTAADLLRSVGLGSKPFIREGTIYLLVSSGSDYQPTYFLTDSDGNLSARVAYTNGGGWPEGNILSSVSTLDDLYYISYLYKSELIPVSKEQDPTIPGGLYSVTGVNLLTLDLGPRNLSNADIGGSLFIAGGFLWQYDGDTLCEQGFNAWPEDITVTPSTTGGSMADGTYFYQVTYEWTDASGYTHRSAPSLPVEAVVSGGGGSGSVAIDIPTLRLTYKRDVRIVVYRWATNQQVYYQTTPITSPFMNDPDVDDVTFTDTNNNATILGNPVLYTFGGALENTPGPATNSICLFKSRLLLINAEDKNVTTYSKEVLQSTSVDMSDFLTIYTSPTVGSQGSTGDTHVISSMDDKILFFKANAIYYTVGDGLNDLGNGDAFARPTLVTSVAGSENVNSVVSTPQGVMFQSNKGIWIIDRSLQTSYIGAPVEDYNGLTVTSALSIPGTNQIRFTLSSGEAVVYDYYYGRWGTFSNIGAISSVVYGNTQAVLTSLGVVRHETVNYYLDGNSPVLMGFTTAWMNLAGLQGFQRAKQVYLLGTWLSSHKLLVNISYDYENSPTQSLTLLPTNYAGTWGSGTEEAQSEFWGQQAYWGGEGDREQYRIFLNRQKTQAFQLAVDEVYNPDQDMAAGAGLTFSGLNMVVGLKKGYVPLPASKSFG
jgi:hypothetical protein